MDKIKIHMICLETFQLAIQKKIHVLSGFYCPDWKLGGDKNLVPPNFPYGLAHKGLACPFPALVKTVVRPACVYVIHAIIDCMTHQFH